MNNKYLEKIAISQSLITKTISTSKTTPARLQTFSSHQMAKAKEFLSDIKTHQVTGDLGKLKHSIRAHNNRITAATEAVKRSLHLSINEV